jgi:predicted TIM-barrel fold metal-dependent hydrolase
LIHDRQGSKVGPARRSDGRLVADEAAQRIKDLPAIDQHCHALVAGWRSLGPGEPAWRRCFTEARRPASLTYDVPASAGYREFVRALAAYQGLVVGGAARLEADVVERRAAQVGSAGDDYLSRLFDDAQIRGLLVDSGYGGPEALSVAAFARAARRPVYGIGRIESIAQELLAMEASRRAISGVAFSDLLTERLEGALAAGAVGFKSIAAYRVGLELPTPSARALAGALRQVDRGAQAQRLDDPILVAHVVWIAARLAAARGVPLQFHTGFGDDDLHLPRADPTLLRALLRDPATEACPVVLLHSHPFVAQAAYLASIYPQVHVDLSLAIPLLGGAAAERMIAEALALCPATKLLAASDGHSYPEMHWRGMRLWRIALANVLAREIGAGRMDDSELEPVAGAILAGNAARLYRLPPD